MHFLVFLNIIIFPILCIIGINLKKIARKKRESLNGFKGIYKKSEFNSDLTNIL